MSVLPSAAKASSMNAAELSLWLASDLVEHTDALAGLLTSGDLRLVQDGDGGLCPSEKRCWAMVVAQHAKRPSHNKYS
jgi:hypothetical protein